MATNIRALAARCCFAVVDKGRSLSDELPKAQAKVEGKDKGLLQELCYGVLRYLPALEHDLRQLMDKPLKGKQRVGHFLILVGIYQVKHTRIPDHAAVSETVAATKPLKCDFLRGLINGVLRNVQRNLAKDDAAEIAAKLPDPIKYSHPSWFIKKVQNAYPDQWQEILNANLERPPMWLRVNQRHHNVTEYLALLEQAEIPVALVDDKSSAIKLVAAVDVNKLPGFIDGWISVQDGAAQQAAILLDTQAGDFVLDCCAAPGGKTCHILELTPDLAKMTAIDIEESRLLRVEENLSRLNLSAEVITADAASQEWWDGQLFDRILLDAPCSATGVIRRHPDIKWLRKAEDIEKLAILQQQILKNIWSLLKPGGILLYATCSILPEENIQQIEEFLSENNNAKLVPITNEKTDIGWQILPNEQSMDGFYYAKLEKTI
ncbi:16S rRNA (cytosine(967)-C(5))-methyltransferase RsmB [Colwellia sp. BRX8-9]|uniref:16S rRNA (cytosine(967)-C(5))-methyltransferase RsmB n=1 Tax=Colwellia sp. BRX8-9 TaxID=2759831 RepID=UPI0015F4C033|nr:16S rRNA (cytosine(967)-C(5))-methyltransferase RsmB [Colwellia sp. BRX8-9]MBA6347752.1 16S rRNA (cytosine(967)-C(5))-methyltransferase RsmB [Colwellia sp. BRX8-9]